MGGAPNTTMYIRFADDNESSGFTYEADPGHFDHAGPFPLALPDLISAGAGFRAESDAAGQVWLSRRTEGCLWIAGAYEYPG